MTTAAEAGARRTASQQLEIGIGGALLLADRSGALAWPAEHMLLVADLHLEKGSAFAARGQMLPPYDSRATLARLAEAIERLRPRRVVALGDSFHDAGGATRLTAADAEALHRLQRHRDWLWVTGNHDRQIDRRAGGDVVGDLEIGGIRLRHEPLAGEAAVQIAGHLHPAARLVWGGGSVRRRCFAGDGHTLVLPAFGAFAGGLNVVSAPFAALFGGRPGTVDMLGADGIYRVPTTALVAD